MSHARRSGDSGLFRRLAAETDESAAVRLFVDLCRGSPVLRHWLWEDFARDATKREHFACLLKGDAKEMARFADLNGESDAWHEETRRLRAQLPRRPYGGRTLDEIKELLTRHQAGKTDAAAFLFALEWQRLRDHAGSPRLVRGAFELLQAAMIDADSNLLQQLHEARALAREFSSPARRRAIVGFGDWWKSNALLYVLRHPASAYRTRELQTQLSALGLNVPARDIRRFCADCGIKRDVRAGRPNGATTRRRGKSTLGPTRHSKSRPA
jgi:hypothetical protein